MTSIATGNERLIKLAKFLEELPPKRFNFSRWVGLDWKGSKDLSCGTTACALGWAATMPEFRRLGLEIHRVNDFSRDLGLVRNRKTGEQGWAAARDIFAIPISEAEALFGSGVHPSSYPSPRAHYRFFGTTPKQFAKLLRKFVKDRSK
jgi:hypothetical protein